MPEGEQEYGTGDRVYKYDGDYSGPGVVRGVIVKPNGKKRYIVGHRIDGGTGEFLHIYSAKNLRPDQ